MLRRKKNKENDLYLSDLQPLSTGGKIALFLTYLLLIVWAAIILIPLIIMTMSSFNGNQGLSLIHI